MVKAQVRSQCQKVDRKCPLPTAIYGGHIHHLPLAIDLHTSGLLFLQTAARKRTIGRTDFLLIDATIAEHAHTQPCLERGPHTLLAMACCCTYLYIAHAHQWTEPSVCLSSPSGYRSDLDQESDSIWEALQQLFLKFLVVGCSRSQDTCRERLQLVGTPFQQTYEGIQSSHTLQVCRIINKIGVSWPCLCLSRAVCGFGLYSMYDPNHPKCPKGR